MRRSLDACPARPPTIPPPTRHPEVVTTKLTRRDLLKLGGAAAAASAVTVPAAAQTPTRAGVFRIRGEDAVMGFDPLKLRKGSNWRELLETNAWSLGHGAPNPAIPAALREWAIPIDHLSREGRRLYEQNIGEAKRLLAEAGYPNGLKVAWIDK